MPEVDKNRILGRISVAARTALAHPPKVELARFIKTGPTIRARARLALAAVFLIAAPILFIGVIRTEDVVNQASVLNEYDDYQKHLLETKIALKDLDIATLAYTLEHEFENLQAVLIASDYLKLATVQMMIDKPKSLEIGPEGFLEGLVERIDVQVRKAIDNHESMAQVRLSIISLTNELNNIEIKVIDILGREKKASLSSLSKVGRDQLILFLILLFAIPIFVVFVPSWLLVPLNRLKQIASKLELGQLLKDMPLEGRDEVAVLARSLKSYFLRRDELDQKKSSKIFEMRNILRSVINRVSEPIFIVDSHTKINYTNEAAALLLDMPVHQIEGKLISDCMHSPSLKKGAENVFLADAFEESIPVEMGVSSGNIFMNAKIGVVRNRDGEVSRAVIVLYQA
jgi:HAMP domain-containing protein